MNLEKTWLVETLSIHQENLGDFLLEQVDSVSKLMSSVPHLSHEVVLFYVRLGINNFHRFSSISPIFR